MINREILSMYGTYSIQKIEDTLYIRDKDEEILFIREGTEKGSYDLTVIIENGGNSDIVPDTWIFGYGEPVGFVVEDITHEQWLNLVRQYKYFKRGSEEEFRKFLHKFLAPMIDAVEYFVEAMPSFDDTNKEWEKFFRGKSRIEERCLDNIMIL